MKHIIYKDQQGSIISELKLPVEEYYAESATIQGNYSIREIYINGSLSSYALFTTPETDQIQLLNSLNTKDANIVLGWRNFMPGYRHEKLFHYNPKKVLETIVNLVFDSENNVVVSSFTEDLIHEIPYWNGTSKYYYDKAIRPDEPLFECSYNDQGALVPITIDVEELGLGDHDGTWIYSDEEGIHDLMQIFNMSRSLAEFYLSSKILPPHDR